MNKSTDIIEELNSKFRFITSETYNVRDRLKNIIIVKNKTGIKEIVFFNDEIWVHDYDRLFKLNLDFNELDTILRKKLMDHNDLLLNVDDEKFFFLNKGSNSFQFYLKIFNKSNAQLIKTFSFNRECLTPNCFVNNYKYIGFDDKSNIFIFYESCILVYDSNGKFLFKKNDDSFLDRYRTSTINSSFFYLLENQNIKSCDKQY